MKTDDRPIRTAFWLFALGLLVAAILAAPLALDSAADREAGAGVGMNGPDQAKGEEIPEPRGEPTGHALAVPGPDDTVVEQGAEEAWVDGTPVPYSPASAFVLPGEVLHIDMAPDSGVERLVRGDSAGTLRPVGRDAWTWTAPREPGVHRLRVVDGEGRTELVLNAFVTVPATEVRNGRLNGYRIGTYPRVPLRGDSMYVRPEGFVEVTRENRDMRVSPRFRLKHFETKGGGGFPRYLVLQRRLLTKLELVADALVERGYPVTSLHVMSGYRTPAYNRAIGNTTTYSRHSWGDAADIFVDEDGDDWMDDLTGDGRATRADARVLYGIVDSLDHALDTRRLVGGLGMYGARPGVRGPFVHLDTRDSRARW